MTPKVHVNTIFADHWKHCFFLIFFTVTSFQETYSQNLDYKIGREYKCFIRQKGTYKVLTIRSGSRQEVFLHNLTGGRDQIFKIKILATNNKDLFRVHVTSDLFTDQQIDFDGTIVIRKPKDAENSSVAWLRYTADTPPDQDRRNKLGYFNIENRAQNRMSSDGRNVGNRLVMKTKRNTDLEKFELVQVVGQTGYAQAGLGNPKPYKMVIGSDPQIPFVQPHEKNYDRDRKIYLSKERLKNNTRSIIELNRENQGSINTVVINGDLTNNASKEYLDLVDRAMAASGVTFMPGLGNHDIAYHNKPEKAEKAMVIHRWLYSKLNNIRNVPYVSNVSIDVVRSQNSYNGSFAYSFDYGDNLHFIQVNWSTFYRLSGRLGGESFSIHGSENFLTNDLRSAFSRGKKTILLMHQELPSWSRTNLENFRNLGVIAVFVGHQHDQFLKADRYAFKDGVTRSLAEWGFPVFYSGAMFYNQYFLLDFYANGLVVNQIYAPGGTPKRAYYGKWYVPY